MTVYVAVMCVQYAVVVVVYGVAACVGAIVHVYVSVIDGVDGVDVW